MPAERKPLNKYRKPRPGPSTSTKTSERPSEHKVLPVDQRSEGALPGLSKIKSAIRQTKRLLAKETLEPGLRIATQRRLTSLEADLAAAERREVEKKNGAKYHKVKFFERQKLLRLTKRLNRKISEEGKSEKKKARYEQDLTDARVMLNYVLHYPNTQKYISLFPSNATTASTSKPEDEIDEEDSKSKLSLPPLLHPAPSNPSKLDQSAQRRYELLQETLKLMDEGKLSKEPEVEVTSGKTLGSGVEIGLGRSNVVSQNKDGKKTVEEEEEKDDFFEADD
ncbi:hypothetical protein CI109_103102 [Kwoniella shandongensis]|uniref:rRNA-processing protein EFG1 n=1 Tax=Kwoniella shandongensis TaxID=1734106 RepID=A0A5M6CC95_9TREE|nr:uncharacterized protein CI109_000293 [Kwoniella shandongensis]KAA5531452.1 hypothetical protein CI109_000293 [Kwoniella shandongensis]